MIYNPCFHRGCDSESFVNAAEIVVHEIQGCSVSVIFPSIHVTHKSFVVFAARASAITRQVEDGVLSDASHSNRGVCRGAFEKSGNYSGTLPAKQAIHAYNLLWA
jgi:hypothetical protein